MINMIVLSCLVILSLIIASPITVDAQPYLDPNAAIETRVEDLLGRLNLQEKVGQMIMDIENAGEKAPGIGSYMIGASDPPLLGNTPAGWRQRRNQLQAANVANQRYGIPLLMAADAVHGHNILQNATIFPHNIGLGCTRNPALVRQVAHVTASEVASTAVDLTFAPTLAVARDMRWGRTYESFSQDTDLVRLYAQDVIQGLQQGGGGGMPYKIVATAKHWIGDGGTTNGDDAGDTAVSSEAELLQIHGLPYNDAIAADVGAIMISFSSVNGLQMHQHERLITQVLKDDKSFQGLVMSDWLGHQRIPGDLFTQIRSAVNAGIDMLMVPYQAYAIMNAIFVQVNSGSIPQSRIDDAVRRILRVKFKAGLFETMVNPIDPNTFAPIRTVAHQDTARQAVRESLVMLRNDNDILPLDKTTTRIFLAGKSADNIQNQCGGWTMSWQGNSNLDRHRIVGGTTVKQGLEMHSNLAVTHNPIGIGAAGHDVAIVVVGETPYAEGAGDDLDLQLDAQDKAAIANAKSAGIPVVLMLISGRPMILDDDILNGLDAIVAAWLPGTEGDGIAQVLFGDYDFTGKLSFSWPRNIGQLQAGFIGHNANVLFPLGYGLSYGIQPTKSPTRAPTRMPTKTPTRVPTQDPATTSHPTSAPTNNPTASPTKSPAPTASPEISTTCSAHPDCTGLAGECCPTIDGLRLACCRPQPPSQVPPSPAPPSPAPPSPAPPSPAPPTPGSSDACAAHPRCVGLAGTCCPVASTGVRLECCNHDQALPPPEYPNQTGLCSAHPRCAALSGDCCPTITGVMLACCDEEQSLAVYQAIVAQQDKSSGGKQAASSPRYWWFLSTLVVAIFLSLIF